MTLMYKKVGEVVSTRLGCFRSLFIIVILFTIVFYISIVFNSNLSSRVKSRINNINIYDPKRFVPGNYTKLFVNENISSDENMITGSPPLVFNMTKDKDLSKASNLEKSNLCPLMPSELVGKMTVNPISKIPEIPKENIKLINFGGRFKPPDCKPREKTAVIIPYRDRKLNLQVLLRHLHTVLPRQKIEYTIYVVEMAYPTQFNRGLLANVGYLTASALGKYSCYIIHDVDLLMMDDRNIYKCGRVPTHLMTASSKFKNALPYQTYFGGILALTQQQYKTVNGFSNLYFGWGGEDDDISIRIKEKKLSFERPKKEFGGFFAAEHNSLDSSNPRNPSRSKLVLSAKKRIHKDGLNSMMYTRLSLEFERLYTWVYVSANEAKYNEKFMQYLQANV